IPVGYLRYGFGFEALPDFDAAVWSAVKQEMDGRIRPLDSGLIGGSDVGPAAISAAQANLGSLPGGSDVSLDLLDFRDPPRLPEHASAPTPPYGRRMGYAADAAGLMRHCGDLLQQRCTGTDAYIYVGHRSLLRSIGLRATWKKPLVSGDLDGRLAKYEIHA